MSKRPKKMKQRSLVGLLGKELTRRSRGRCELCGSPGGRPWEIPPFPEYPEMDRTLMLCPRCTLWMEVGTPTPGEHHVLSTAVWSELPPVRLAAARLLLACPSAAPWLRDSLGDIDPESGEYRAD